MTDATMPSQPRRTPSGTPGRGRRPKRNRPLWAKVLIRTVLGLFTLFLLGVIALVIIYLRTDIPQPNAASQQQTSIAYYDDGKTPIGRIGQTTRDDVQLSQVPVYVQNAFLSAEDRTFYKNNGVSMTGIARAIYVNLTGGAEQGGSTITQQYVKNYFLSQDRSVTRKLKEAMIAIKIDKKYSKQQILQDYLNNITFGRNSTGIQAASKAYFNKDVSKLTVSEGAYLAAVINAPSYYNPSSAYYNEQAARQRVYYVLAGMVKEGWLTQAEMDKQTYPTFAPYKPQSVYGTGPTSYLLESITNALTSEAKLTATDITRGGLRITTTFNKDDQAAAVASINKNLPTETARLNALHAGLVAQKPDGSVVAMYGGTDVNSAASSATYATMQGGSSFKVFATAAALDKGYNLSSPLDGSSPLKLSGVSKPIGNDQGEQFGTVTLRQSLAYSVNTAFVRLNMKLGSGTTLKTAEALGIPANDPGMNDPNATDVLGTAAVHVIDMSNAFSTIGAEGKKATPHFITKITAISGNYSYDAPKKTEQAISHAAAVNTANAMQDVLTYGTAKATAGQLGRPAGGKTGTVGLNGTYLSAWFTGFTPNQLTASVGMYAGNGKEAGTKPLNSAGQSFYGGDVPATIWLDFMKAAVKDLPVAQMPKPEAGSVTQSTQATVVPPPVTTQAPTSSSSSSTPTSSTPSSTPTSSTPSSTPTSSTTTSRPTAPVTSTVPPPVTSPIVPSTPPPVLGSLLPTP